MKTACFTIGLHLRLHDIEYKIDRITEEYQYYLLRISDGGLIVRTRNELLVALSNNDLLIHGIESAPVTQCKSTKFADLRSLSEERQIKARYRHEYVCSAIKLLGDIPTKVNLDVVVKRVSSKLEDRNSPSLSTVYRWWKTYVESGNNIVALGGKSHKKTGHYAFNDTTKSIVYETINEAYMKVDGETAHDTYQIVRYKIERLNLSRITPLRCPSRATFYRMLNGLSAFDRHAARKGLKSAQKKFIGTGAGPVATRILERVEVDHTPIDVLVIDDNTGLPIGRPTFTCLIDCYSRMILGYYIGFETTSLVSVFRALRHAILPKDPAHHYMSTTDQHWPAYGIPELVVLDNGLEFHANDIERVAADLHFDKQYCPKQEPRFKGKIERFMGTFNRSVAHNIPGTTKSNIAMRGDYKPEGEAIYTESEFACRATQWVVDIYCREIHSITLRPPVAMWEKGLNVVSPMLPESEHALSFCLTKQFKRSLSHSGIRIHNLDYNCSSLNSLRFYHEGAYEVDIRVDTECISHVWVRDEKNGTYLQVPCTAIEYASGLSLRQHEFIRKQLLNLGKRECDEQELLYQKYRFYQAKKEYSEAKLISQRRKGARLSQPIETSINSLVKPENGGNDKLCSTEPARYNLTDFEVDTL